MKRGLLVVAALLFVQGWLETSHFSPWVSWHAEVPFFLASLIAAWAAALMWMRRMPKASIPLPLSVWPFLLLLGLATLQFTTGRLVFFGDLVVVCFYLLLCVTCLTIGFAHSAGGAHPDCTSPNNVWITALALSLLVAGLVSTVVAWAQVLELWERASWILRTPDMRRAGGNMGQPNHLATLLAMAVASAMYLDAIRRLGALAISAIVGFLCSGLVLSQSRAGALGLLLLLAWWLWKQPLVGSGRSRWWGAGAAALFIAMFLAWLPLQNVIQLMGADGRVPTNRLAEGSLRFKIWPQLVDALLARPSGGWGFLQVAEAHNSVADKYTVSEPYSYSHNLILDLALWMGLPLAALLTVVTLVWLWRRARTTQTLISWYGLAVALPVGVHAMLEFPHAYAYFLAPAMLALGAVEGVQAQRPHLAISVKAVLGMLTLATVLMVWSVIEYLQVEEDFRVARFEMLNLGQTPADYERPTIHLLTQLGAMLESSRIQPSQGMSDDQLDRLKQVAMRYPWSGLRYRYALALALNGNQPEAIRQMQVIRALHGEVMYRKLQAQLEERLSPQQAVNRSEVRP